MNGSQSFVRLDAAVLNGGPFAVPRVYRFDHSREPSRVVVDYHGGREHFEETAETMLVDGDRLPVYRWIYRTRTAE
ncbi:DUF5988 family protein [Sciscionella sediminilitoris]|uniref:DUF5988 family protein n=1 Tax=Sciscionella sediminilitoris TaxID=1445613 RepID=UPI0004DF4377|nr:DUF5988 family protein [Sciscionella sp. SE31]